MIDGLYKSRLDRFWDRLALGLVWLGLSPNQVTMVGLVLVGLSCVHFLMVRDALWFGILLGVSLAGDSLDGAVARLTGRSSRFGGYLDAVVDRYQEILVFLVIAQVRDCWGIAFMAMSGSMMVSYNKARVAIEIPIDNFKWPDLLERTERVTLLTLALLLDGLVGSDSILWWGVLLIGVLSHLTAIQRFLRARRLLLSGQPESSR